MNRSHRRRITRTSIVALAALLAAGCGGSAPAPERPGSLLFDPDALPEDRLGWLLLVDVRGRAEVHVSVGDREWTITEGRKFPPGEPLHGLARLEVAVPLDGRARLRIDGWDVGWLNERVDEDNRADMPGIHSSWRGVFLLDLSASRQYR